MMESILTHIYDKIAIAAIKSGRNASDVCLVGVTKTMDVIMAGKLVEAGLTDLGENKVQELLPKYEALSKCDGLNWHFIGHLQRNKVKFIIDKVKMIHSVDSLALAKEIDKRAKQVNKTIDILIEVNIASEENKHGVSKEDSSILAKEILTLKNIRLQGLMCIAPFVENPEDNRLCFENMRKLLVDINKWYPHNLKELSMGMSGDYAVAIEEGATMVRIGTALMDKMIG